MSTYSLRDLHKPKFKLLPPDPEHPRMLRWRLLHGHVILPEIHQHVFAGHEVQCEQDVFWSGLLGSLSWPAV